MRDRDKDELRTPMDEYLDVYLAKLAVQHLKREQFKREAMAGIREIPTTPHPKGLE